MNRFWIILIILLLAGSASATTFTAVASGDWNSNATWGTAAGSTCGTNIPCMTSASLGGDQVVIPSTYVVTCTGTSEVCSAGTSPANQTTLAISVTGSGGITVGGTATLIYAGPVNMTNNSVFTVNAGGTIQCDTSWAAAPTTAAYNWTMATSNASSASFALNGSSGAPVTWQGDASFSSLVKAATCSLNACRSGTVGGANSSWTDNGWGAITYTNFDNMGLTGTTPNGFILAVTNKNTSITHTNFLNSATMVIDDQGTSGTGNVTLDRGFVPELHFHEHQRWMFQDHDHKHLYRYADH